MSLTELDAWLDARSWKRVDNALDKDSVLEWYWKNDYIKLVEPIFDDDGKLKIYSEENWNDDWLVRGAIPGEPDDDEIPF